MAFIPPTIDDVRHCSNALSVDPAEIDAARAILGAEALCRWVSAERGVISPLKFITIAEDIGFINELGGDAANLLI